MFMTPLLFNDCSNPYAYGLCLHTHSCKSPRRPDEMTQYFVTGYLNCSAKHSLCHCASCILAGGCGASQQCLSRARQNVRQLQKQHGWTRCNASVLEQARQQSSQMSSSSCPGLSEPICQRVVPDLSKCQHASTDSESDHLSYQLSVKSVQLEKSDKCTEHMPATHPSSEVVVQGGC